MNDDGAFALLITWTCYGTWLPSDARGHVSNVLLPEGDYRPKQNTPGTPVAPGAAFTRARARSLQKGQTVLLRPAQARCAATALVGAARERGWRIPRAPVEGTPIATGRQCNWLAGGVVKV
jgi:hypothetical protein